MKRKVIKVFCISLAVCIIGGLLYIGIGKYRMENKMLDYLKKENYREADIASMKVDYSFHDTIISHTGWIVEIVYADEPASRYYYTLRDGEILESGIYSTAESTDFKH